MQLYERSQNSIWTDRHIAAQLLEAHLDPETDAASRSPAAITRAANWIRERASSARSLLDLGCGPGLYAELFAQAGLRVTGVDISQTSIDYARRSCAAKQLSIDYICANYLELELAQHFDLIICIYCDFGALTASEQSAFLRVVDKHLADGGSFIFDVFGEEICTQKREGKTWNWEPHGGFWSKEPHYLLEEMVHFAEHAVWGRTFVVIERMQPAKEYIFWDHYYDEEALARQLNGCGFDVVATERGLVAKNSFASDDVIFVQAQKQQPAPLRSAPVQ